MIGHVDSSRLVELTDVVRCSTMMVMKWHNKCYAKVLQIIAVVVIIIAWCLRCYKITTVPLGATVDEVSYGYIAYSLTQTGRDEHGVSWPLLFTAYGDQKLPGQVYMILPWIYMVGPGLLATRLPSVLASCVLVVAIYYLVRAWSFSKWTAWLITCLYALSPAPFLLGRGAWESNIAMLFWTLGWVGLGKLMTKRVEKAKGMIWTVMWMVGWAATWYFYIPYRAITGVLMVLLVGWSWLRKGGIYQLRHYVWWAGVGLLMLVLPIVFLTNRGSNLTRFHQLEGGTVTGLVLEVDEKRTFCELYGGLPRWWCDMVYNKLTVRWRALLENFTRTVGIDFMVNTGEKSLVLQPSQTGEVVLWAYLLAVVGCVPLLRALGEKNHHGRLAWLLIVAIMLAIGPTILVGGPQKVRMSALWPMVFLLAAWGGDFLLDCWQRYRREGDKLRQMTMMVTGVLMAMITVGEGIYFLTTYFTYDTYAHEWENLAYVREINKQLQQFNPDKVYWHVSYPDALMFYAFDSNFDPVAYQQTALLGELEASGFQHTVGVDNRYFVSDVSIFELACDEMLEASGESIVVVEQEALILQAVNDYLSGEKTTDTGEKTVSPVTHIYSTNGAHEYAQIIDVNWYRQRLCPKEGVND